LAGAPLEELRATRCAGLRSVASLKGAPLSEIDLAYTAVADLRPLSGARIREADLSGLPVVDFSPLRSWRLNRIWLNDTRFEDFGLFREMALEELHAARVPVRDFGPLTGLPLRRLTLSGTAILNLEPLVAMNLDHLDLSFTRVTELRPLTQSTVHSLMLHGCNGVQNWEPLREVSGLRRLSAPAATVPKRVLQNVRLVALFSAEAALGERDNAWRHTTQVDAFWKKYGRPTVGGGVR